MLAGEPVEVSAVQTNTESGPFRDVESDLTMTLTFPDGVVATCSCSYTAAMNSFTATAERGSFGMRPAYSYSGNRGWRSDGAELSFPPIDHFVAEMDDFAECIMTGRQTRVPGRGLRDVHRSSAYQTAQVAGRYASRLVSASTYSRATGPGLPGTPLMRVPSSQRRACSAARRWSSRSNASVGDSAMTIAMPPAGAGSPPWWRHDGAATPINRLPNMTSASNSSTTDPHHRHSHWSRHWRS
jgi:hypothetical protein